MGSITGSFISGSYLGYQAAKDRDYTIIRKDESVFLNSNQLEKSYPLVQQQNEIYLGDADHQFKGLQALTGQTKPQSTPTNTSSPNLQDVLKTIQAYQTMKNSLQNLEENLR